MCQFCNRFSPLVFYSKSKFSVVLKHFVLENHFSPFTIFPFQKAMWYACVKPSRLWQPKTKTSAWVLAQPGPLCCNLICACPSTVLIHQNSYLGATAQGSIVALLAQAMLWLRRHPGLCESRHHLWNWLMLKIAESLNLFHFSCLNDGLSRVTSENNDSGSLKCWFSSVPRCDEHINLLHLPFSCSVTIRPSAKNTIFTS